MRNERLVLRFGNERIATWRSGTAGAPELSSSAATVDGVIVLFELKHYGFAVTSPSEGLEYRIRVGDFSLEELLGDVSGCRRYSDSLEWPNGAYFESSYGQTRVTLDARAAGSDEPWGMLLVCETFVNPTKIGVANLARMESDIARISRSLLSDLYGKSDRLSEFRAAHGAGRLLSPLKELTNLEDLVEEASALLGQLQRSPSSRIARRTEMRRLRLGDKVSPQTRRRLGMRGQDPNTLTGVVPCLSEVRYESFDIPEHRTLSWLAGHLSARADRCARFLLAAADEIRSHKRFRDIRFPDGLPSLYESEDLPRIRKLEDGAQRARAVRRDAERLRNSPILAGVPAVCCALGGGQFLQSPEYRHALKLIRLARASSLEEAEEGSLRSRAKESWRLFEQWCFLRLVEAFRRAGLPFSKWEDSLGLLSLKSRFVLDFRRGTTFVARFGAEARLRIRYEPWIMGLADASATGESLFRGHDRIAWSPDIVIELQRPVGVAEAPGWATEFAMVLDAKYTRRVSEALWDKVCKYDKIRSTATKSQVRQLCILHLGDHAGIRIANDEFVVFDESGPSCNPEDRIDIELCANPAAEDHPGGTVFDHFATGMLRYMESRILSRIQRLRG